MRRQPPSGARAWRGGLQAETQTKNRIQVAQITTVDTRNGAITVRTIASREQFKMQIPLGGFSIRGLTSSWIRYMPQAGDFVRVGYNVDGTPEVLGYTTFDDSDYARGSAIAGLGIVPHQAGYAGARVAADSNTNGMQIFRELQEGEWDMRSSGGAEVYGNRYGVLTLAGGGGAYMTLDKKRQEEVHKGYLCRWDNNGVEMRLGDVRRALVAYTPESTPVTPNAGAFYTGTSGIFSTYKEFKVSVGWPDATLLGAMKTYWTLDAGTPTSSLGLPLFMSPSLLNAAQAVVPMSGAKANPLRYRQQFYGVDGLAPMASVQMDYLGNTQIELLTAPIGLTSAALRQYHHATNSFTIAASTGAPIWLGSEGATQSTSGVPGAKLPQAYVLGTVWKEARVSMNNAITGACSALATAATTANTAAQIAALAKAIVKFAEVVGGAVSSFETAGQPTGFLSLKIFGE